MEYPRLQSSRMPPNPRLRAVESHRSQTPLPTISPGEGGTASRIEVQALIEIIEKS